MLRRFHSLLLVLACVFAPVGPALAAMLAEPDACCCEAKCPCAPMTECAPAPSAPLRTAPNVGAATEQAATAAKPATRVTRMVFTPALASARTAPSLSIPAPRTVEVAPAGSVALFQAHCSLLI